MWTREKDPKNPGAFAYTLYDGNNFRVHQVGGFATAQEADRAAERAQRELLFPASITPDDCDMTDDDLLAALLSDGP